MQKMYKKNTGDLEKLLEKTHPDGLDAFLKANEQELLAGDRPFMRYMNERLKEKGLKKQEVLTFADIPLGYGYKLFSEEKVTRQRDVILRICYAAKFTVKETQTALEIYHMSMLYARDPRDALLMTCFNTRPGSVIDINALLIKNKFPPLRSSGVND